MLPMLPMQRVSGSGRALSAALLSRECIMCSRDCGSLAAAEQRFRSVWSVLFHPSLAHAPATGYRMDAGAAAGAEPRCLAKRRGRNKSGEKS